MKTYLATQSQVTAVQTTAEAAIPQTQIGVASGVASLSATGTVPATQLPPTISNYASGKGYRFGDLAVSDGITYRADGVITVGQATASIPVGTGAGFFVAVGSGLNVLDTANMAANGNVATTNKNYFTFARTTAGIVATLQAPSVTTAPSIITVVNTGATAITLLSKAGGASIPLSPKTTMTLNWGVGAAEWLPTASGATNSTSLDMGVYRQEASQSIPNSTLTKVTGLTGVGIASSQWDAVNSRYVISIAGTYRIKAKANWTGNNIGTRTVEIKISGASSASYRVTWAASAAPTSDEVHETLQLSAGHIIEAFVQQDSGGALSLAVGSANTSEFELVQLPTATTVPATSIAVTNAPVAGQSLVAASPTTAAWVAPMDAGSYRQVSVQAIANNGNVKITGLTSAIVVSSQWDAANNRYLISRAGTYLIVGRVVFSANASGVRQVILARNGGWRSTTQAISSASAAVLDTQEVIDLAVGDYIELCCFQNSGRVFEYADINRHGIKT